MEVNEIVEQIEKFQVQLFVKSQGGVEIAPPHVAGPVGIKIRTLLTQMVDKVFDIELEYRRTKAARLDSFLKDGMKKSPAIDQLEFEPDLIDLKIKVERLKNYMKYADSLVSMVQSHIRSQQSFGDGL